MSDTPPWCSTSWVDLSTELEAGDASSVTPCDPLGSELDYIRMLREAQSETSCRTSARVSPIVSALVSRNSPISRSPKSPPNSPNTELADLADYHEDLRGIIINQVKEPEVLMSDFMWDWSSRPNMLPPKEWGIQRVSSKPCSLNSKATKPKYSARVVCTMVLTNVLSLIIGAGIGMWLYRRGGVASCKIVII